MVITGGEPTMQEALPEFAKQIKQLGFKVKLDTNGTNLKMVKYLVGNKLVDYIAMDVKAPLSEYKKVTNVPDINELYNTIKYLKTCGIEYEFRTTFVPNLTVEDIVQILHEIKGAKTYSLQAYIKPEFIKQDFLQHHTAEEFYKLKEIGKEFVHTFNIKNL